MPSEKDGAYFHKPRSLNRIPLSSGSRNRNVSPSKPFLRGYGASLYQGTASGSVRVEFTVSATRESDLVGVSKISVYKGDGTFVTSVNSTVSNGLLVKGLKVHAGDYTYYGETNEVYYMVLTMYAERDGGSDSRLYITNQCRG